MMPTIAPVLIPVSVGTDGSCGTVGTDSVDDVDGLVDGGRQHFRSTGPPQLSSPQYAFLHSKKSMIPGKK